MVLKSVTKIKADAARYNFHNIKPDSATEVELTINLGDLVMKARIEQSFDDFLAVDTRKTGNLYILTQIRSVLQENGVLYLINTYEGLRDSSYNNRLEILLNKAGFIDIAEVSKPAPGAFKSVKRPLVSEDLGYGLTLREIIDPSGISDCHAFAKDYYYYKDFNYDLDVVSRFDLNCDHFAVFDENNKIYSMARSIIRVPGYYCPFMYAIVDGSPDDEHFTIPGKDQRIGELMAIYSAGKTGVVAFKRMMEYMTQYGTDIAHFDSVWSTYDEDDNYTGTYYKNKFLMDDTGVNLKYGDFGGTWRLLVTDRIAELKELHHKIFSRRQE